MGTEQLTIENKGRYLSITLPPYDSVSDMQARIIQIYDAAKEHQCGRLFIDATATRNKIPIFELFEICIFLVEKLGPLNPKIAVLSSPEAVYADRFGENVVRNRGLDLIRFVETPQEAASWLTGDPAQ